MDFWSKVARLILRNKNLFIILIIAITGFMMTQWKYVKISYAQKSILPNTNQYVKDYNLFKSKFPNDNSVILIGIKDSTLFTKDKLNQWNNLSSEIEQNTEIESVISIHNLKVLKKDTLHKKFVFTKLLNHKVQSDAEAIRIKKTLFDSLPFYESLLFNKKSGAVQMIISLKKEITESKKRAVFIQEKLIPLIDKYKKSSFPKLHVSGLIYIKTLDAKLIKDEIPLFLGLTLLVSAIILLFFFRSFSPMIVSLTIVGIAVMWTFGFMGLLGFQISILTAIIPPLVIVIGVPNAIFLINKYQQEIKSHGNQAKSLQRLISKTGNAILMTNLTTAIGFGTFVVVNNKLLKEFGIIASLSILSIFLLSILIIPITYSYKKIPKEKYLRHLNIDWSKKFINWLIKTVRYKYQIIFGIVVLLIIISMIGAFRIKVSGSILADLPRNKTFYKDIKFFENEFGGILPLEIMIDTKRKKGAFKDRNLRKADQLQKSIEEIPELSRPVSLVNLVKYVKQSFYNGNPKYYQLPSRNERAFILSYLKKTGKQPGFIKSFTDSTQQVLRITSYMKDVETDKMEKIEDYLSLKTNKLFPKEKYNVVVTGKAKLFLKGTHYLIDNLILSLGFAIFLIFMFIAWMFRWSMKMAIISLIPNLLPLLITAGLMGYAKIPLKPSTILIFSIAFGISVDDTIHYLAKLRQELRHHHRQVKKSVYKALRETGLSMFYTSVVLFFGFSVFLFSSYGGTKALGGLISFTLLIAMFSNLLLLPALVLFLDRFFKNKEDQEAPELVIFPEDNDEN